MPRPPYERQRRKSTLELEAESQAREAARRSRVSGIVIATCLVATAGMVVAANSCQTGTSSSGGGTGSSGYWPHYFGAGRGFSGSGTSSFSGTSRGGFGSHGGSFGG